MDQKSIFIAIGCAFGYTQSIWCRIAISLRFDMKHFCVSQFVPILVMADKNVSEHNENCTDDQLPSSSLCLNSVGKQENRSEIKYSAYSYEYHQIYIKISTYLLYYGNHTLINKLHCVQKDSVDFICIGVVSRMFMNYSTRFCPSFYTSSLCVICSAGEKDTFINQISDGDHVIKQLIAYIDLWRQ